MLKSFTVVLCLYGNFFFCLVRPIFLYSCMGNIVIMMSTNNWFDGNVTVMLLRGVCFALLSTEISIYFWLLRHFCVVFVMIVFVCCVIFV